MLFVQHPRSADLAEMPRDRIAVVGSFRKAQACSQQAGNDVIDLYVQVLRVNGELQLQGRDRTSKSRHRNGNSRRRNAVAPAGEPASRWQHNCVVQ